MGSTSLNSWPGWAIAPGISVPPGRTRRLPLEKDAGPAPFGPERLNCRRRGIEGEMQVRAGEGHLDRRAAQAFRRGAF
jgi:hypothetical protein